MTKKKASHDIAGHSCMLSSQTQLAVRSSPTDHILEHMVTRQSRGKTLEHWNSGMKEDPLKLFPNSTTAAYFGLLAFAVFYDSLFPFVVYPFPDFSVPIIARHVLAGLSRSYPPHRSRHSASWFGWTPMSPEPTEPTCVQRVSCGTLLERTRWTVTSLPPM